MRSIVWVVVSNRNPKLSKDEQKARVAEAREALNAARAKRSEKRRLAEPVEDSAVRVQYERELAAHRSTTERLMAEKDQRIQALEALVAELRRATDSGR